MLINLIAGSGAHRGPGQWIFSKMTQEIVDRLNLRDDMQVVLTAEPDRSQPYDVYHYFHSTLAADFKYMLHRALITVHSLDTVALQRTFYYKEASLARAPMVTAVSRPVIDELLERGMDPDKLHFTPYGVDLDLFRPAEDDLPAGDIRIGIVGRRYEDGRKGERFLCEILELLARRLPRDIRVTIVFVGPNWETGPITELLGEDSPLIGEDGLSNINFEFTGMLDEPAVAEVYRGLDGCIVTSSYPECGPMCVLESLATGIPVVSTPGGHAIHFLHRSGSNMGHLGAIVAYGDVEGFYQGILDRIISKIASNRTAQVRQYRSLVLRQFENCEWGDWTWPEGQTGDPLAPYSWRAWADRFAELYLQLAAELGDQVIVSDYISQEDQNNFRAAYRSGATSHLADIYVQNFMQVMPYARSGPGFVGFANALKGLPAVVVGMGPSLDDEMENLKKHRDEIAIVVCDAGLKKMLKAGITPDLVVVADPTDKQIENFSDIDGSKFLTLIPTVVHPMVFHEMRKSECLPVWYNIADPTQEICKHIPRAVGNKGAIEPAVLTTGMAFLAALYMGAWPITFLGMDLCWYDFEKGYASGVSAKKADWQRKNKMFGNVVMLFPDMRGKVVVTEPCFISFWQWMNDHLEENDLFTYNSSGRGILHGPRIRQMPFSDWLAKLPAGGAQGSGERLMQSYRIARMEADALMCHQYSPDELAKIRNEMTGC